MKMNQAAWFVNEIFVKGWYFATIWLNFNLLLDRMLFIWSQIPFKCIHGLRNTYSNLIFFSLSIYQSVSWSMCWGAGAKLSLKKIGLWFWIHEKKMYSPNLRSMIYLQELTQLVRGKSKLEFNKKPLEEGGGNGCFLVGARIFPTLLLKNKGCRAVVPFAVAFITKAPCFFVYWTSLTWWKCWSQLILDSLKWTSVI